MAALNSTFLQIPPLLGSESYFKTENPANHPARLKIMQKVARTRIR